MKLETFFEKFDLFADAPEAVGRIRELVLTLATSGRLLEQGSEPKPALNELLREKESELKKAKVRKHPKTNTPGDEDLLFEAPHNWLVCRLGDLCWSAPTSYGENPSPDLITKSVVKVGNISPDGFFKGEFSDRGFSPGQVSSLTARAGDLMVVKSSGSAENVHSGKTAICAKEHEGALVGSNFVLRLRPLTSLIDHVYLWRVVTSRTTRRWVEGTVQTMTYPNLKWSDYSQLPIALPPLAEQKRIVAKVDELMTLCDRLEAQHQVRDTRHAALARASLARFAKAPTPKNLNFLFHSSFNIPPSDLRKSILTLAVQGKLVPQDRHDESADKLVSKLKGLKAQLLEGKKIRKQKVSADLSECEFPFEIPDNWEWVRLGQAVSLFGGFAYQSSAYIPMSSNQVIRLGNVKSDALLIDQNPAFISDTLAEKTADYAILEGDILITMTGTKAKRDYAFTLAVSHADLATRCLFLNQRVGAIRPFQKDLVPLINVFLKSDQLLDLIFATATGTANQANIGTSSIIDLPFPLPPLAEQRRIVAKVDQLMTLVDELETRLLSSRATAKNLLEALVAELTANS